MVEDDVQLIHKILSGDSEAFHHFSQKASKRCSRLGLAEDW